MTMEPVRRTSPDLTSEHVRRLAELFPSVVTETRDAEGTVRQAVDFDLLRQELSDHVVEGPQERYQLDWPGKRAAAFAANAPTTATLRPDREESVNFDSTKNVFIEGDNLEVLKVLQESYLGKVKMIYIDPPYNTGRDFIYDDDFAESTAEYLQRSGQVDETGQRLVALAQTDGRYHSDWLSMMHPRLKLARNLLTGDGAIFISIDDHEVDNLRKLCDEVFGARNFVAQIIWQKVYSPKNSAQFFSEDHDYILVYARDKNVWRPNSLPRTAEMEARYKNPDNDPRGPWKPVDLTARNAYRAGLYPITSPSGRHFSGPPRGRYWGISEEKFRELNADGRIWWGADDSNMPALKRFLGEMDSGRTPQTLWPYTEVGHTQDAKKTLLKYVPFEHTENVLNSVKPVQLIQRILQLATSPGTGDIVMDFFGGSGTTPHAVLTQNADDGGNRRYIAVQMHEPLPKPEPRFDSILGMSRERLRNLSAELRQAGSQVDVGFRAYRLDASPFVERAFTPESITPDMLADLEDPIHADRTPEDLLIHVLLAWGLDLSVDIRTVELVGQHVFDVEDGALLAAFGAEVTDDLAHAMAQREPARAVFLDSGFASDAARINVEQIFREITPATDVKVL
ncbi:site-specific DNA-methyltransferase [Micrococcus luteus]|uniref:site-specific DNA-methyltransferase n=1 Tax=Micrococcus luteus TaxID=1270 RepID=UPI0034218C8E|nr:site-specific DNA-methyltransferase [Micrococcus luteus]MCV7508843.1 site-specific DNA-methyltransferase [Micrococcus luteus]MCV7603817.1 site-specific DNA-methyltransferase [Micrococcus luteus]